MRPLATLIPGITALVLVFALSACGGSSTPTPPPPPPSITVSVSPGSPSVAEGATQQFTATVTGTTNTGVTWTVDGIAGGNDFVGAISAAGLYTAPVVTGTHTVTATSQADTTKTGTATVKVTVSASISVVVTPATLDLTSGGSKQFKAVVQGTSGRNVNWQVNGIAGGNSAVGTVDANGNYTAPASIPNPATVTLTAVLAADSTKSGTASVTVVGVGPVSVAINPATSSLGQGGWEQFDASVTGSANTAVTWQVNEIPGGNATVGTIDNTGLYLAPVTPPSGGVSVTAVSAANTAKKSPAADVTVAATDPLGQIINSTTLACPATKTSPPIAGTCYQVTVTGCPGVEDQDAWVKVTSPSGTPKGTVVLTTGTGGENLYEQNFTFGPTVVNNLVAGGFTAAQMTWASPFATGPITGWLTGTTGVRRAACRVNTFAQWIKNNASIHSGGSGEAFCATGNSGGSGAIAYGLAHYGMDSIFDMVEPTSGPPFGRIDYGCVCTQPTENATIGSCSYSNLNLCYGKATASGIIDAAYGTGKCSNSVSDKNSTLGPLFLADSVDAPGGNYTYPKTNVHFVFGGLDTSQAIPLGLDYANQVTAIGVPAPQACVADAPHPIPNVQDGATQVSNDLIALCKKQ